MGTGVFAQEKKIEKGEKKFDRYAFIDAREILLKVANKGYKSTDLFSKLGDSYYFNNDYENALKWYGELYKMQGANMGREHIFRYAQTLKSVRRYDEADQLMTSFRDRGGSDMRADAMASEPDYLSIIDFQKGRFDVQQISQNSGLQDFGPAFYGEDKLIFASNRDTGVFYKRIHAWNDKPFLDLYVGDRAQDGRISNVKKFDSRINTRLHESTPVFTADGNTMYFTRNNFTDGDYAEDNFKTNRLKIYRSTKEGNRWSKATELNFNGDSYASSHPALTPDGKYLYFSSNRPGSIRTEDENTFVETDIWRASISGDTIGEPELVENINTTGRETFPFISKKGNLYFASNGLNGLGGLDIFVSTLDANGVPSIPLNVGEPANSAKDDFAFIIDDDTNIGYFSSNRRGGTGDDDIYRFRMTEDLRDKCEQVVTGTVTNVDTGLPLAGATITVSDSNNNVVETATSTESGKFGFVLDCNTEYFIKAEKDEFITDDELVSTPSKSSFIDVSLALEPEKRIAETGTDLGKVLNLNPIYFDFDRFNIRYDAEIELQKVLAVMEQYPSMVIDIRSHTDSRGNDAYNMRLSDKRARSTRQYLIDNGIASSRLTARGYGESALVNECRNGVPCSKAQHQLNRRSEFIIVSQ